MSNSNLLDGPNRVKIELHERLTESGRTYDNDVFYVAWEQVEEHGKSVPSMCIAIHQNANETMPLLAHNICSLEKSTKEKHPATWNYGFHPIGEDINEEQALPGLIAQEEYLFSRRLLVLDDIRAPLWDVIPTTTGLTTSNAVNTKTVQQIIATEGNLFGATDTDSIISKMNSAWNDNRYYMFFDHKDEQIVHQGCSTLRKHLARWLEDWELNNFQLYVIVPATNIRDDMSTSIKCIQDHLSSELTTMELQNITNSLSLLLTQVKISLHGPAPIPDLSLAPPPQFDIPPQAIQVQGEENEPQQEMTKVGGSKSTKSTSTAISSLTPSVDIERACTQAMTRLLLPQNSEQLNPVLDGITKACTRAIQSELFSAKDSLQKATIGAIQRNQQLDTLPQAVCDLLKSEDSEHKIRLGDIGKVVKEAVEQESSERLFQDVAMSESTDESLTTRIAQSLTEMATTLNENTKAIMLTYPQIGESAELLSPAAMCLVWENMQNKIHTMSTRMEGVMELGKMLRQDWQNQMLAIDETQSANQVNMINSVDKLVQVVEGLTLLDSESRQSAEVQGELEAILLDIRRCLSHHRCVPTSSIYNNYQVLTSKTNETEDNDDDETQSRKANTDAQLNAVTPKTPAESADNETIDLCDSPPTSLDGPHTQQEEESATLIGTPDPARSTGLLTLHQHPRGAFFLPPNDILKAIQDHRKAAGSVLKADRLYRTEELDHYYITVRGMDGHMDPFKIGPPKTALPWVPEDELGRTVTIGSTILSGAYQDVGGHVYTPFTGISWGDEANEWRIHGPDPQLICSALPDFILEMEKWMGEEPFYIEEGINHLLVLAEGKGTKTSVEEKAKIPSPVLPNNLSVRFEAVTDPPGGKISQLTTTQSPPKTPAVPSLAWQPTHGIRAGGGLGLLPENSPSGETGKEEESEEKSQPSNDQNEADIMSGNNEINNEVMVEEQLDSESMEKDRTAVSVLVLEQGKQAGLSESTDGGDQFISTDEVEDTNTSANDTSNKDDNGNGEQEEGTSETTNQSQEQLAPASPPVTNKRASARLQGTPSTHGHGVGITTERDIRRKKKQNEEEQQELPSKPSSSLAQIPSKIWDPKPL